MEDWWKRAKTFAEEAAKKSQTIANSTRISDLISETTKKSKDLALEASKAADQLKVAALKQADQLRSISEVVAPQIVATFSGSEPDLDAEKLGVTSDLRDFVKGFTATTFQSFPIQEDEPQASDAPPVASNVRQDLNEWQAKHATLVLTTVKEISKLRYELCPRIMKERRFWRIYFTLVNTYVSPYEKKYIEEARLKAEEQAKENKQIQPTAEESQKSQLTGRVIDSKVSASSSNQQDLDSFLLGDLDDSDGGSDDGEVSFSDDFDKIDNLEDEDEEGQKKLT
ncbi:hypothetical protein SAY87_013350 [Trapa incisa]|uniref:BSD domain-containing protein n=1 Tax=Trapa incisa TaxID=236973 RepID=A0AAN7KI36_9MYRT|nr:hypothetical protein SAY87_013350 [Trapa incisa]